MMVSKQVYFKSSSKKNNYKKTHFFIVTIAVLILGFVAAVNIFALGEENQIYQEVVVKKGDTLWELARIYGTPDSDPRMFVYTVRRINNMNSPTIHPGDNILVPISR